MQPLNYASPSDRDKVRLLIADTDADNEILTDDQIDGFLAIEGGSVKHGAASALDAIASSEALISKKIRTLDGLSTDGPAVAAALREHADRLRSQAVTDDDGDGFDVVDFVTYPLTGAELAEAPTGYWPV